MYFCGITAHLFLSIAHKFGVFLLRKELHSPPLYLLKHTINFVFKGFERRTTSDFAIHKNNSVSTGQ
jgi:hypothetical protein